MTLVAVSPQIKFTQQDLSDTEKAQARQNIDAVQTSDLNLQTRNNSFSLRDQYFWNVESGIAVFTPLSQSNWLASSVVPVKAGESYTVSGGQGATHKTRIWVVTEEEIKEAISEAKTERDKERKGIFSALTRTNELYILQSKS